MKCGTRAYVNAWRQGLEGLLGLFSGDTTPEDDAIGALWRPCQEAFGRFKEAHLEAGGGPFDPSMRAELEELRRIHAVVSARIVRHRDGMAESLLRVSRQKGRISSQASGSNTGLSCDIRG